MSSALESYSRRILEQSPMLYPTKRIHFGSLVFDVNDDVYEPAEDSFLFAENLGLNVGESVLDLGTGSGILAVTTKAAHVLS